MPTAAITTIRGEGTTANRRCFFASTLSHNVWMSIDRIPMPAAAGRIFLIELPSAENVFSPSGCAKVSSPLRAAEDTDHDASGDAGDEAREKWRVRAECNAQA